MKKIITILAVILATFVNCSDDDTTTNDSNGIKDQVLTGTVKDQSFTFEGGKSFYVDDDLISIHLTNEPVGCESDIFDYGLEISTRAPREEGTYSINIVTSSSDGVPSNFLDSALIITSISEDQISGKMKVDSEGGNGFTKNVFEGSFTVPICK